MLHAQLNQLCCLLIPNHDRIDVGSKNKTHLSACTVRGDVRTHVATQNVKLTFSALSTYAVGCCGIEKKPISIYQKKYRYYRYFGIFSVILPLLKKLDNPNV